MQKSKVTLSMPFCASELKLLGTFYCSTLGLSSGTRSGVILLPVDFGSKVRESGSSGASSGASGTKIMSLFRTNLLLHDAKPWKKNGVGGREGKRVGC